MQISEGADGDGGVPIDEGELVGGGEEAAVESAVVVGECRVVTGGILLRKQGAGVVLVLGPAADLVGEAVVEVEANGVGAGEEEGEEEEEKKKKRGVERGGIHEKRREGEREREWGEGREKVGLREEDETSWRRLNMIWVKDGESNRKKGGRSSSATERSSSTGVLLPP